MIAGMGMSRQAAVVLLISMGLNLFLAGLVVGRVVMHPFPPPPPSPARFVDDLAAGLPASDGAILRQEFRAHAAELDQARARMDGARDDIGAALEAPTLDLPALQAALAHANEAKAGFEAILQGTMLEGVRQMSPEGRRGLVRMMPGGPPPPPR